MKTADVIIVGSGASGLFNALFIPGLQSNRYYKEGS